MANKYTKKRRPKYIPLIHIAQEFPLRHSYCNKKGWHMEVTADPEKSDCELCRKLWRRDHDWASWRKAR